MDTTDRSLETIDAAEIDAYIDQAIDRLFVPNSPFPTMQMTGAAREEVGEEAHAGSGPLGGSPVLNGLREAVLSLEWEVEEEGIRAFEHQVSALREGFGGERHVDAVLEMAGKVGKYLRAAGEGANPLAVGFPTASLSALETLLAEPPPSASEKKTAVAGILEEYRRLQAEVRRRPDEKAQPQPAAADRPSPPAGGRRGEGITPVAATAQEPVSEEALVRGAAEPEEAPIPWERHQAQPETEALGFPPAPGGELEQGAGSLGQEANPALPRDAGGHPPGPREADDAEPEAGADRPEPPPERPADHSGGTAERLLACLQGLQSTVRAQAERWRESSPDAPSGTGMDGAGFCDVVQGELTSALELACRLAAVPEAERGADEARAGPTLPSPFRQSELQRVYDALEALTASVHALDPHQGESSGGASASGGDVQSQGPEPQEPAPSPAYLASVAGSVLAIPPDLVARAAPLPGRVADRIRQRGYATLEDLRRPFRSLKRDLSGPLARLKARELRSLQFRLVPEDGDMRREPGGAVLLSDGSRHALLFTDEVLEPVAREAATLPRFRFAEAARTPPA
ncbi:MAG: hypothetical protein SCH98_03135 [Deferrisomatales bacterium]|nr:hypothetical protein [Deferrisomatales bacterium]